MSTPRPICACPRCGYDLSGTVDSWTTECPLEGVCSECGLSFYWGKLISVESRKPCLPYDAAFGKRQSLVKSALQLVICPWKFWRQNHAMVGHSWFRTFQIAALAHIVCGVLCGFVYVTASIATAVSVCRMVPRFWSNAALRSSAESCLAAGFDHDDVIGSVTGWTMCWLWGVITIFTLLPLQLLTVRGAIGNRPINSGDIVRTWLLCAHVTLPVLTAAFVVKVVASAYIMCWLVAMNGATWPAWAWWLETAPESITAQCEVIAAVVGLALTIPLLFVAYLRGMKVANPWRTLVPIWLLAALIALVVAAFTAEAVRSWLFE